MNFTLDARSVCLHGNVEISQQISVTSFLHLFVVLFKLKCFFLMQEIPEWHIFYL